MKTTNQNDRQPSCSTFNWKDRGQMYIHMFTSNPDTGTGAQANIDQQNVDLKRGRKLGAGIWPAQIKCFIL
jgi:hypothetical protein